MDCGLEWGVRSVCLRDPISYWPKRLTPLRLAHYVPLATL